MPLLSEYALIPDVFDPARYTGEGTARLLLQQVKDEALNRAVIRDLRAGEWSKHIVSHPQLRDLRGKEIVEVLRKENRLRVVASSLAVPPTCDADWCDEAVSGHKTQPLTGVVATKDTCERFRRQDIVARVDQLHGTSWWTGSGCSVRIGRTISDYGRELDLLCRCANSLMFIDPYLDPKQNGGYRDFIQLLLRAGNRVPAPKVEIHRVCYFDGRDRRDFYPNGDGWRQMFEPWRPMLRAAGMAVECFIWDDFHDRYLISNLIGISIPYGFDTTTDPRQRTTWTRLSRTDRADVELEFLPAANRHERKHQFIIG